MLPPAPMRPPRQGGEDGEGGEDGGGGVTGGGLAGARPAKRARKQKEYVPGVGTANYAFLITLYMVRCVKGTGYRVEGLELVRGGCGGRGCG